MPIVSVSEDLFSSGCPTESRPERECEGTLDMVDKSQVKVLSVTSIFSRIYQ